METGCRAVALTCIDFRFVEPLRRFLAGQGLTGDVDVVAWPGGAAGLTIEEERERLVEALALARSLHRCDEAILCVHEDCGRLGGSAVHDGPAAERAALTDHLRQGSEVVRASVPDLERRAVLLMRSGEVVEVDA